MRSEPSAAELCILRLKHGPPVRESSRWTPTVRRVSLQYMVNNPAKCAFRPHNRLTCKGEHNERQDRCAFPPDGAADNTRQFPVQFGYDPVRCAERAARRCVCALSEDQD